MRIASFNVENLFERAKAFNLDDKAAIRAPELWPQLEALRGLCSTNT
jgi:hypothetical protein